MEAIAVLLGIFFLASPFIAIIALVQIGKFRNDLDQLRREVRALSEGGAKDVTARNDSALKTPPEIKQPEEIRTHDTPDPEKVAALVSPPSQIKAKLTEDITVQGQDNQRKAPVMKSTAELRAEAAMKTKAAKPKAPPKPKPTIEEMIGSQWSVWVGGIALAIGAVFLLRFSIEAGVFSPAMRLGLAAILGLGALAGGEWMRRGDPLLDKLKAGIGDNAVLQQAYIPGVLTAVGIFTWLGVIYAAHALYGFFGPGLAFILLGMTSLLGLALGLLHGPKLAALGLVAAFATPLLVGASEPNYIALFGYLLLIAGAAIALAHRRDWPEITAMALLGLLGWCFLSIGALNESPSALLWAGFAAFSYGLGTWAAQQVEGAQQAEKIKEKPSPVFRFNAQLLTVWTLVLGVILMISLFLDERGAGAPAVWTALSLSALFVVNGARWRGANIHILIGGVTAILALFFGNLSLGLTLPLMGVISVTIWGLCFLESRLSTSIGAMDIDPPVWAGASVAVPLIGWVLILLKSGGKAINSGWLRVSDIGPMEGLIYIALALLFTGTAEYLWRQNERKGVPINIYAFGSGAAILCAILFCIDIDFKFYALLLSGVLAIGIYFIRPLWSLQVMISGTLALALLLAIFHHIQGNDVGTTYIFNALWIFLALPAAICFGGAWILQREGSDIWSEGLKAAGLSSAALFIVMQIHHLMNSGQVLATNLSLEETALFVLTGLCFTFGASWLERGASTPLKDRAPHEKLMPVISIGFSMVTIAIFVFAVCIVMNPLINGAYKVKGNFALNTLVLAYLLPALLLAAIALWTKASRPTAYVRLMGGLGFLSFMIFITSMVRYLFTGAQIDIFTRSLDGMELYAISAVWLVIGIGLLIVGLKWENRDIRLVSGLVIILTVLKAFLIDMSNLEGVLRAMSFVILGVVLIVIGRVYQKLIFSDKNEGETGVENITT